MTHEDLEKYKVITLDFETFWSSKDFTLSKMGPIQYIRDPRFSAQMIGVRVNKGPVKVFEHDDIPCVLQTLELDKPDRITVAHNGNGFDFLILSEIYGVRPAFMVDTICMERWIGLSRIMSESHAELTRTLGTGVKRAGTVISDGKNWPNDFTPAERQDFMHYCAEDVEQCSENFYMMAQYVPEFALQFMSMTAKMATQPSFEFDASVLNDYLAELDAATDKARQDLCAMFHFQTNEEMLKAIRSKDSFCAMLKQLGVEPPMKWSDKQDKDIPALAKSDIEFQELREHPDERVQILVNTRLEQNSSIHRSRAEKFLSLCGKPVPIMLGAFKADTSRYTASSGESRSDGLNFQNISKRNPKQATLRKAIKAPAGYKVVACDSSQVEARLLAYIAKQDDLVNQFREGLDPYAELASKFGGGFTAQQIHDGAKHGDKAMKAMRNCGKVSVLSAGYGVGWKKYADTLWKDGTHLHSDRTEHGKIAQRYHQIYRNNNQYIVYFWDRCMGIIKALAGSDGVGMFGGPADMTFYYGKALMPFKEDMGRMASVLMPTGFRLWYPNLRWEEDDSGKIEYVYDRKRGKNIVPNRLYGGKLTENLIQGLAFQMLGWQAVKMQEDGIQLVGNVHDSWFTVVKEEHAQDVARQMEYWMSQVPDWLPDFPVACEVEVGDDYSVC